MYNLLLNSQASDGTSLFLLKPFLNDFLLETIPIHRDNRIAHEFATDGAEIFMRGIFLIDVSWVLGSFGLFDHMRYLSSRCLYVRYKYTNRFGKHRTRQYNIIAISKTDSPMRSQQSQRSIQSSVSCPPSLSCIPVTFVIGDSKCQYQLPTSWSIFKVKCLLVSENNQLNFDQFQLMYCGKRLQGQSKIMHIICDACGEITLVVLNIKSQITFNQYYTFTLSQHLSKKHQPIMHNEYQKTLRFIQNQPRLRQEHMDQNQQQIEDQILRVLKIMQLFGWTLFFSIVVTRGHLYQIVAILGIVFSHYLIDIFKKKKRAHDDDDDDDNNNNNNANNGNNNNHNDNQRIINKMPATEPQNKPIMNESESKPCMMNRIKAQLLIRYYKISEFIFCFVLMLFPNWDLHLFQQLTQNRVREWREEINELRPGTYEGEWVVK